MTGRVVFLCEESQLDPGELGAVKTCTPWAVEVSVTDVRPGDLVIARHYAWPWPKRLDRDLALLGARALNNARDYDYCNTPARWAADLGDLTPETWEDFSRLPEHGPFFLKGPKADKGRWDRCYAETRADAIALRSELQRDTGMRGETIVARRYVPLERLGDGLGGVPPAVEFRVFVLDGEVVSRGFYWPPDDCDRPPPSPDVIPEAFLREAIGRVGSVDGRAPLVRARRCAHRQRHGGGRLDRGRDQRRAALGPLRERPTRALRRHGGDALQGGAMRSQGTSGRRRRLPGEDQQRAEERIPHLLATPAAVRFLSCEPLLGPVDIERALSVYDAHGEPSGPRCNVDGTSALGWVIVGGESGPGARPMREEWVRSLRDQCAEAGVPVFFKQLGDNPILGSGPLTRPTTAHHGADPKEWPVDLRVQEFPKGTGA